jgi:protein-tyrosine phosphatase
MCRNRNFIAALVAVLAVAWAANVAVDCAIAEPPNYNRVEPGLYLGGSVPEPPRGVTAVLNLCEVEDRYTAEVHSWQPIRDAAPAPDLIWLRTQVDFVREHRTAGRTVYVHCFAGVSRSAMVVAAYLMWERGLTRDEALRFLREKRPEVRPNPAFLDRLAEWEREFRPVREQSLLPCNRSNIG